MLSAEKTKKHEITLSKQKSFRVFFLLFIHKPITEQDRIKSAEVQNNDQTVKKKYELSKIVENQLGNVGMFDFFYFN